MPSPFPGMDPYLEQSTVWERFHAWFVRKLTELSLPKVQALGCWIDVEYSVYQREPGGEFTLLGEPDETLGVEQADWSPGESSSGGAAVAVTKPQAVHEVYLDPASLERFKQAYLVVREKGKQRSVLAVVEVLSPANKSGGYKARYQDKRRQFMSSPAHFLEIDFLRSGENLSRDIFIDLVNPYFIFLARKTRFGRSEEVISLRLQDPLPVVGLPLSPSRPILPLDLPAAFAAAYDLSIPPWLIHYNEPPPGPLSKAEEEWIDQWLRGKGLRS